MIGSGSAILLALLLARFRLLGRAIMPYAIAASAIPIVAFAPITNNWFGVLNPLSKMVIAAVLCFFPVLVNTLREPDLSAAELDPTHALLRVEASSRSSGRCGSRTRCRSSSRP